MRRASACQACPCWTQLCGLSCAGPGRGGPGRVGRGSSVWSGPGLADLVKAGGRASPARCWICRGRLLVCGGLLGPSPLGGEACCQRPGSGPAACGWSGPSCRGPPPAGTRLPAGLRQARGPRQTGASRPDRCGPAAGQAQRPDPRLPRGSPPSGDSSAGCCDRSGPRPAGRPRPGRTRREGWFPYPADGLWPGRCRSPRHGTCRARSPAGPGWLVRRPRRSAGSLRTRCR